MAKVPKKLYVVGDILEKDSNSIAVVGSRLMTSYGQAVVKSIVGDLVDAGLTIVSGLSYGVDIASQKLAVDMGGRTIAVLGSGIKKISPTSHETFAREIVDKDLGAVISQFEPYQLVSYYSYPLRDYLIAALSKAVLIIEASEKSGTSYVVDAAIELGKEVFAVPGSIFNEFSLGCNKYIKDGAHLVRNSQDIFDVLGEDIFRQAKIDKDSNKDDGLLFNTDTEKLVFDTVCLNDYSFDALHMKLKIPASKLLMTLSMLEMKGYIASKENKYFRIG